MSENRLQHAIVIQRPQGAATQLLLLFHGVGSQAEALEPLGRALAAHLPSAWVVSVRSPDASDLGRGWQWFSVVGVSEANRPARVAATLPRFVETVRQWQKETGVDAASTTLLGFSQGAIMALESTQQPAALAGRVIAIAGRFAEPPRTAPAATRIHLLHGDADTVMPVQVAHEARQALANLKAEVTLDVLPDLGHGIDERVLAAIVARLPDGAQSP